MRPLAPLLLLPLWGGIASLGYAAGSTRVAVEGRVPSGTQGGLPGSPSASGGSALSGAGPAPAMLPSSLPNPIDPVLLKDAESVGVEPRALARSPAVDPAAAMAGPARVAPALLVPAAETVRLPASAVRPGSVEPRIPGVSGTLAGERRMNGADEAPGAETSDSPQALETGAGSGSLLFDGARKLGRGLLGPLRGAFHRLRRGFQGEDKVPGFPGAVGESVRLGAKRYRLEKALPAPEGQALFMDRSASHEPTFLRFYSAEEAGRYELQRQALLDLAKTDIPHARLVAAHDAGRLLVQETFEENESFRLVSGKPMSYGQRNAFGDLFYKLVALGKTVDLSPANLKWSHWRGHWALKDAESYEDGAAWDALGQWLFDGRAEAHGADPVELLAGLRGRFGPDAPAWKRIVEEGRSISAAKRLLDALGRRDAARAPPPSLSFKSARAPNEWLRDALIDESEMRRRFGFYPLKQKGVNLHFDKGKLNTSIMQIGSEGSPWVRKIASQEIIRNELFMRKVVHRWFGEYFDAPWSVARYNGYDSYMMMEKVDGSHWGRGRMGVEQRVALAILMNTFGIGDVNLGNILSSRSSKKPVLIDFEQALSRSHPVTNRIPDEGILTEMPWVDARGPVESEEYQAGIAHWRELFSSPAARAELRMMLREVGFTDPETAAMERRFEENVRNLPYTLQADVEFANYFHRDRR